MEESASIGGREILEVVGIMLSAALGYFLGKAQNRDQTRRDQAAEALTEIKRLVLDLQDAFATVTTPPEYWLPDEPSRLEHTRDVTRKLDELNGY